ncbi:MAG: hypothetical protein AAGK14_02190 [Verrucomicrobiota bacterium]
MRYTMFRHNNGMYYLQNRETRRQKSLRTKDKAKAQRLLNERNQMEDNSAALNYELGTAYLTAADPEMATRTWEYVARKAIRKNDAPSTKERKETALRQRDLQGLLRKPLLKTSPEYLLELLEEVCPSSNTFLWRWQNFALRMGWLPRPIVPPICWPKPKYGLRRAITKEEYEKLKASCVKVPQWADFLECLWWTGSAQGDMAKLDASKVDFEANTVCFHRGKITDPDKGWVHIQMGPTLRAILLRRRNNGGHFFPELAAMKTEHRANYFKRRLDRLGLDTRVTLHCYRYAVIQRCRQCDYPERLAKALVGHSRFGGGKPPDVHDAYLRNGNTHVPSLEQYENRDQGCAKIIPFPGHGGAAA